MKPAHPARINPFPAGDPDRYAIWELLVERDIAAFLAEDWPLTAADFLEDGFVGQTGPSNPDHWRIAFPTLAAYRDFWIQQAADFSKVKLIGITNEDFLFETTTLRDIEIRGDHALAHKKFDGHAKTADGEQLMLSWQSLYRLRRIDGLWKVSGFIGYLPNPMPAVTLSAMNNRDEAKIQRPATASQHKAAGPYSPVLKVRSDDLAVLSGQGPIDDDGEIVGRTIEEQTRLTLQNCIRQLESAGLTLSDVFKVTVYLGDMSEWARFNQVYKEFLREPYPVRTAIQAVLWGGIRVEIDMMAAAH